MNTLLASIIRTLVPLAVGQVTAWLLLVSIVLDEPTKAALGTFLGGLITAVYYLIVRLLEQRWPGIGVLLGLAKSPDSYSKESQPVSTLQATLDTAESCHVPGKPDTVTWDHIDVADAPPAAEADSPPRHSAAASFVVHVHASGDPAQIAQDVTKAIERRDGVLDV